MVISGPRPSLTGLAKRFFTAVSVPLNRRPALQPRPDFPVDSFMPPIRTACLLGLALVRVLRKPAGTGEAEPRCGGRES